MAAKHKYENARLDVTSTLSAEQLNELAAQAGEAVVNSIPGMPKITVGNRDASSTTFKIASLGGHEQLMGFRFRATPDAGGSKGTSEIVSFRTSQPRYLFIPVGPKSLLGWREYKRFAEKFRVAVLAADPQARCTFVERPAA